MDALLLIDLQNDFCPLGALEVAEGDQVIPVANGLAEHFDLVVATQDWHPADHGSFAANHLWRKIGQTIDLHGLPQILWPIHCVQETFGAEFHADLDLYQLSKVIRKGTNPEIDSYSGFFDNGHRQKTGMHEYLQKKKTERLYVLGLATDYCVKFTVLDALELGYEVFLVLDGCRGVNLNAGDVNQAITDMRNAGAIIVHSEDILLGKS